jgi:hypothetical protein
MLWLHTPSVCMEGRAEVTDSFILINLNQKTQVLWDTRLYNLVNSFWQLLRMQYFYIQDQAEDFSLWKKSRD